VKAAAHWWGCDVLALLRDPDRDVLVRRALIALKAEGEAGEAIKKLNAEWGQLGGR
jgi:hypothetical protein